MWKILISSVCARYLTFQLKKQIKALNTDDGIALFENRVMSTQHVTEFQLKTKHKTVFMDETNILDLNPTGDLPDHTDHSTVLNLAKMTENAYYEPEESSWNPIDGWNVSSRFGWANGGIRGYVYESTDRQNLVIVIKGTSLATPIGSGPTAKLDKLNDNMMFSCCCAKAGWGWTAICDCPITSTQCSLSCLKNESSFDGSYYNLAQTIYLAVKEWYPRHTNIWTAGHSLGGSLASLVALTNGIPAFAYESPGDLMYAQRIGLLPQLRTPADLDRFLDSLPIYHFGNSLDPIFLGECTGVSSSCYWFDYALESKCHSGKECIYDMNSKKNQNINMVMASVQYHSINYVIKNIIEPNKQVPKCTMKSNCLSTECPKWEFVP